MKKLSEVHLKECQTTKGRDFLKSRSKMEELEELKSELPKSAIWVLESHEENETLLNDLEEMKSLWENIGGDMNFYELCDLIEYLDFKKYLENKK
jgi:hypothetical protein